MKVFLNGKTTARALEVINTITPENWTSFSENDLALVNSAILYRHNRESIDLKVKRLGAYADRAKNNLPFLFDNRKTGDSIDFIPGKCQFKCTYCYVNNPCVNIKETKVEAHFLTPSRERLFVDYLKGREKYIPHYPLRFFSLSDCPDRHVGLLNRLLLICKKNNTETIVITKNENVLPYAHDVATVLLYSVDRGIYNSPTSIERYVELSKQYPNLRLFIMVIDIDEIKWFKEKIESLRIPLEKIQWVAYHGQFNDTPLRKTPVNAEYLLKPMFLQLITGRACCSNTNKCLGCTILCGINKNYDPSKIKYRFFGGEVWT